MTEKEKERAMLVSRNEYPQDMPCAICRLRWMQHKGTLCPARPGYIGPHGELHPPVFGDTTFIPDVNYFKRPDFEVI